MSVADEVRRYWDEDSAVYDDVPNHHPTDVAEQAAWSAALRDLLPPPPARVLDCGAGTGFLSLTAARLGYQVTALDLSPGMLARLREKAAAGGLAVEVVEGPAEQPPAGRVRRRHRAPSGVDAARSSRDSAGVAEGRARRAAWSSSRGSGARPTPSSGCAGAPAVCWPRAVDRRIVRSSGAATTPSTRPACGRSCPSARAPLRPRSASLVADAGWPAPRLYRLRDIEWASVLGLGLAGRVLGVPPRFAIVAGS